MDIKKYIDQKLNTVFEELGYDTTLARTTFSDRTDIAHFQCNGAFVLAKSLHKNPLEIAQTIADKLCADFPEGEVSVARPGFINILLGDDILRKVALDIYSDDNLSIEKISANKTVVLDYGGANIAKPLHVGHLRSAIIGESIKKLYEVFGYKTISDVHLGDWGLQMGLTIAQLMDDYDMSGYFDDTKQKTPITLEMLDICYPKASQRKKVDEEFYSRASEITLKLQSGYEPYVKIWKKICDVSLVDCKNLYIELGCTFDLWNGESSVNYLVPSVIDDLKNKKLAHISDGALVVDVDENTPPAIILKNNGSQMYAITDIATIVERVKNYNPDQIVYITDARQGLHFYQVFTVCQKANFVGEHNKLVHIGYGTVNGKDGRPFKTRDGGAFKLRDLIDMVTAKAKEKILANNVEVNDIDKLSTQIAMGAIKFGDLSNVIAKDYIFDIDKFTSFEGKTGPYIQYTGVRIKSLLNKANWNKTKFDLTDGVADTKNIILAYIKYIDAFSTAFADKSLNSLCMALYDLCSAFSTFYNNVKILSETDEKKRNTYLSICHLVLKGIEFGANIIGFEIPDKM